MFINEVFINPSGDATDKDYEIIELLGTPGMKLDGYAVALLNGTEVKYHPEETIPPVADSNNPEIDEFFSLDGQILGDNASDGEVFEILLSVEDPNLTFVQFL